MRKLRPEQIKVRADIKEINGSHNIPGEIREARGRLGLSQAALAALAGVSESSVKRLEDPDRLPRHRSRVLGLIREAIRTEERLECNPVVALRELADEAETVLLTVDAIEGWTERAEREVNDAINALRAAALLEEDYAKKQAEGD